MILFAADTSRPVRAVAAVVSGWVIARAILLWPAAAIVEGAKLERSQRTDSFAQVWAPVGAPQALRSRSSFYVPWHDAILARVSANRAQIAHSLAPYLTVPTSQERVRAEMAARPGPEALPPFAPGTEKRFSGSFWSLARTESGGSGLANGGQLGGSQIGARLFYAPGPRALALTARFSAPLGSRLGREASIGVALRGKGIGLIVEQRFALDSGGHNAASVTAYAGISEMRLGRGIRFDGYAQAGFVGIAHPAGFVDGAARLETTVTEDRSARLSAGLALSGGAQPGVSRLDIGPQLVARLPVAGKPVRVSAEWRQRIAGNAAPGSGPAVTVGFDF